MSGTVLGVAVPATVVSTEDSHLSMDEWNCAWSGCASHSSVSQGHPPACLVRAEENDSPLIRERRDKLLHLFGDPDLPEPHKTAFKKLLAEHHSAFSVEKGERGETDLIKMESDIGNAPPIKQPVCCLPIGVSEELAKLICAIQKNNVIKPSKSLWANPIILV